MTPAQDVNHKQVLLFGRSTIVKDQGIESQFFPRDHHYCGRFLVGDPQIFRGRLVERLARFWGAPRKIGERRPVPSVES